MTHISRFFFFALKFRFVTTIVNVRLNKSTPYDLSLETYKSWKGFFAPATTQTARACRAQWILLRNHDRRESCERLRARTVRVHSTRSLSATMCSLGIHGSISSFHLFSSHVTIKPRANVHRLTDIPRTRFTLLSRPAVLWLRTPHRYELG